MDIATKRCSKCGVEYPATHENFSPQKYTRDRLETRCRACERERNRRYREQNRQKEIERKRQWRAENPDKVRGYNQWYRAEYRDKVREIQMNCWEKNREKYLERNHQWRAENLEKERKRARQYAADNREKHLENARQWRAANPQRVRELDHQWKTQNPEKALIIKQRREARKRGLPDQFTLEDYANMMGYWGNRCAVCEREATDGLIIVPDHWIPLSDERPDNPGTVPDNIVPLCHSKKAGMRGCNNTKWRVDSGQWLVRLYGEKRALEIKTMIESYFVWTRFQRKTR